MAEIVLDRVRKVYPDGTRAVFNDTTDPDFAVRRLANPGDRLRELALAVPRYAGDRDDFPEPDLQRNVLDRRAAISVRRDSVQLEHHLVGRGAAVSRAPDLDLAPDHQRC